MITRRAWLETAGRLTVGAVVGCRLPTGVSRAATAPSRTIDIEARSVRWELAPGRIVSAMTYNGKVPGPEIRAREGERLRVVFKNSLDEATTIHWHGVDVPNAMDGVPDVTQKPIPPGETFVYEFEARPAGTRWYHTHVKEHRQMDLGLAAPLVIEPAAPGPIRYDRDVALVLDDWATGAAEPVAPTREGTAGGMMRNGGMMGGRGMGGMMRGGMMRPTPHEPAYDTMTINGRAYPSTEPLRVRKGERVRLRLINASNEHTHVVRLAGHRMQVTHTDGNSLRAPVDIDAVPIAPAERYDVIVIADRPGAWFLHCTQPGHAAAGEQMLVLYEGAPTKPAPPESSLDGLLVWHYGLGHGRSALASPGRASRTFDQTLSGGMMGGDEWTINGKVWPRTDSLSLARGDRGVVRFRNMSPEAHPMHLHGQSFRVLAINGARYAAPITKDTVDVDPHMGSAVVEFTADNPGDWLIHCHKPAHMDGGMIALVKIR